VKYIVSFFVLSGILTAQISHDGHTHDVTVDLVEFVKIMDPDGTIRCVEVLRSQEDFVTFESRNQRSDMHIIAQTVGRRDKTGKLLKSQSGLDIILRGTDQLNSNPQAVAAFAAAAARWEERLMNPVTVTIDVDYGPTRFGEPWSSPNVLGSTSSAVFNLNSTQWRNFANALIAQNPQYRYIYNNIPDTLFNTTAVVNPRPSGSLANLLAIGMAPATSSVPSIGFNSNFTFDLDPSNGISSGQTDFDAVAVHEIGHALGFVSVIGSTNNARTWDIFRFRPGVVKDTVSFRNSQRVLTPGPSATGGDHVFWDGAREWELSTATGSRTGGDGQQASHWRDDALRTAFPLAERKIGIMDPNLASGVRDTIKLADLKALSIMGWKIDLGNLINPVEELAASSDYLTPNAIALQWKNPSRDFGGYPVTSFKIAVYRNGQLVKELTDGTGGMVSNYIDSNLTQYQFYSYRIAPVHIPSNDSGFSRSIAFTAGGSPRPAQGSFIEIKTNQSTVYAKFKTPSRHDDNTVLHNLKYVKFYRNTTTQPNLKDSVLLSSADTGKTVYFIDTPPPRFLNNNTFHASFVGEASVYAEGQAVATPIVKAGIVNSSEYLENFEVSRQSVVNDDGWDSTNISARSGSFSFGILNYPNNYDGSAYIPMIKGAGSPMLRFWTVCRIEPNDTAYIQVSKNRGSSWNTVMTLNASMHSDWQAGVNTWFKKEIVFSGLENDTILVRFRLKTDNSSNGFGWLIDDISLSPVLTSVENQFVSIPDEYSLSQNYPNPFNPTTMISYSVKEEGNVRISVFDIIGREIAVLVNEKKKAGWYTVPFDGANHTSGIYFYRIDVNEFSSVKKMVYLR
jgi:hypothetical protein